jgi:hypothetical protein
MIKELGIKPGNSLIVLNAPDTILIRLASDIRQVRMQQTPGTDADVLLSFQTSKEELEKSFDDLQTQIARHGAIWIAWPKIISGIKTDLKREVVSDIGKKHGMREVSSCEMEFSYGALKFVYPSDKR